MPVLLRRKGDGVEREIELSPGLTHGLEHSVKLAWFPHVARREDRRLELSCKRLHIGLRLFVEIGNRELGEGAERLSAPKAMERSLAMPRTSPFLPSRGFFVRSIMPVSPGKRREVPRPWTDELRVRL